MSAAYNGSIDFRPAKSYFLNREKERLASLAVQKEQDRIRLDELFEKHPGRDDVERDEEKIAQVLTNAERRMNQERQNLLDSRLIYSTPSDFLGTAYALNKSKPRKQFGFEG